MQLDPSAFADSETIERAVRLPNGQETPLRFRVLSHGMLRKLMMQDNDEEAGIYSDHRLVAACLVDDEGNTYLSPAQASSLKPLVFKQICDFAQEANAIGQEAKTGNA